MRLHAAEDARGTCGWYARLVRGKGRGTLPDRTLGTQTSKGSWQESCVLGVSPSQAAQLSQRFPRQTEHVDVELDYTLRLAPWWMRFDSFFGDRARYVRVKHDGDEKLIATGSAGAADGAWWASTTCGGRPAVHVVSMPHPYNEFAPTRERAAFHAYVTDIAHRRGCTLDAFPSKADFRE
ncbi:hypothetical protein ACTWP9_29225 [Streptomyces sp. 3N207]